MESVKVARNTGLHDFRLPHRISQRGQNLLLEGGEKYYAQLFDTCDIVFSSIGGQIKQQVSIRTADMQQNAETIANFSAQKEEQEQQIQEVQGKLERLADLKKLFA